MAAKAIAVEGSSGPSGGTGLGIATKNIWRAFELLVNDNPHSIESTAIQQIRDAFDRFRVWARNIGAQHDSKDPRSLEQRLRQIPELVAGIRDLLQELDETLCEIRDVPQDEQSRLVSSADGRMELGDPDPPVESPGTEMQDLSLIVGDIVTSLLNLSTLLRKATVRDRYAKAAAAGKDYPFNHDLDIRHVKDLFPKVTATPWLASRLGKAITKRRQFLRYSLEHRERLAAQATFHSGSSERYEETETLGFGQLSLYQGTIAAPSIDVTSDCGPTIAQTTATTVQPEAAANIDVRNLSALNDNDDAVSGNTSFASTASGGPNDIKVPRLDTLSINNASFECPYCRGIVGFKHQATWKRHVFHDLRAYVCTFEDCTAGLFQERSAWWEHEVSVHRRIWTCITCENAAFAAPSEMKKHLRQSHASTALQMNDQTLNALVAASSRPMEQMTADLCPLCDTWNLRSAVDAVAPLDTRTPFSPQAFRRHLAGHLEQLALSAIPVSFDLDQVSDNDSDPSNGQSDSSSRMSDSMRSTHGREDLMDCVQIHLSKYFHRRYGDKFAIEGDCPGPWTRIFARRFLDRTMLSDVVQIENQLSAYLDAQTALQNHRHVDPTAENSRVSDSYWISKEVLLLEDTLTVFDVPARNELHALSGLKRVKSSFDEFLATSLKPPHRETGRLRPIAGGKSRLFLGPPGAGLFFRSNSL